MAGVGPPAEERVISIPSYGTARLFSAGTSSSIHEIRNGGKVVGRIRAIDLRNECKVDQEVEVEA